MYRVEWESETYRRRTHVFVTSIEGIAAASWESLRHSILQNPFSRGAFPFPVLIRPYEFCKAFRAYSQAVLRDDLPFVRRIAALLCSSSVNSRTNCANRLLFQQANANELKIMHGKTKMPIICLERERQKISCKQMRKLIFELCFKLIINFHELRSIWRLGFNNSFGFIRASLKSKYIDKIIPIDCYCAFL